MHLAPPDHRVGHVGGLEVDRGPEEGPLGDPRRTAQHLELKVTRDVQALHGLHVLQEKGAFLENG